MCVLVSLCVYIYVCVCVCVYSQVALVVKNTPAKTGDLRNSGSIPGSGIFLGEINGNPLQYSCLENSMDRGAWRATVHRVAESDTIEVIQHIYVYIHVCSCVHTPTSISKEDVNILTATSLCPWDE